MYSRAMPGISLSDWRDAHPCEDNVAFRVGLTQQATFVADKLSTLLFPNRSIHDYSMVRAVGEHPLGDAVAPVYAFAVNGVEVRLSGNRLYGTRRSGWIVSVKADGPILDGFGPLFDRSAVVEVEDRWGLGTWAFGSFEQDRSQFTLHLPDEYKLYTFLFLLARVLEMEKSLSQIGQGYRST